MSLSKSIFVGPCLLLMLGAWAIGQGPATTSHDAAVVEKKVLARLDEIQTAAQSLDADKVFEFVLENDKGALVQDGKVVMTRADALQSTKQGFSVLTKIDYRFEQQQVTMLSPTIALVVGEGVTSATTKDGGPFTTRFAQSVVLKHVGGEWKVFHAHRSFPRGR